MSSEATFSLTTKVMGDLFTVRGDTADEFKRNLFSAAELIDTVAAVVEAAHATTPSAQARVETQLGATEIVAPHAAVSGQKVQPPTPAPQQADHGPAPSCVHGTMTWREGISGPNSKNPGTPYRMWTCPERNRDAQCKPVWVK